MKPVPLSFCIASFAPLLSTKTFKSTFLQTTISEKSYGRRKIHLDLPFYIRVRRWTQAWPALAIAVCGVTPYCLGGSVRTRMVQGSRRLATRKCGNWRCIATEGRPTRYHCYLKIVCGAQGHQRPNFDDLLYIHYAAPPYSARISTIYLLSFGKVCFGSVCCVQRLATKQNEEIYGGWVKMPVQFGSVCGPKFKKFSDCRIPLLLFNAVARLPMSCFVQKIFAIKSRSRRKTKQMHTFLAPNFWDGRTQLFYGGLLALFTVQRLAKFGWAPFAGLRLQCLAMK